MVRVAFAPYGEYDLQFLGLQVSWCCTILLSFPDLVVVRPAFLEIPLSNFMEILQSSSKSDVSAYLEYSSIASLLPELELDINEIPFVFGELRRRHLNIWLSNGNT